MVCHLNGSELFDNSVTRLIVQTVSFKIDKFLPIALRKAIQYTVH